MADRLDDGQGHSLVCQEPQGPAGMACGWLTASERDQSRLPLAIEERRARWTRLFLPVESSLQPLFDQSLSDAMDGIDTDGETLGDALIRPGRAIGISFQQDLGMPDLVCRRFPFPSQLG